MIGIILFICLTIQAVGTYFVWPSRYNIGCHMNLGFIFVAYFVPLIVLDYSNGFTGEIINLYALILIIGTAFYLIGLVIGNNLPLIKINYLFHYLPNDHYAKKVISITKKSIIAGIVGMIISFAVMGYIPALTSDPLMAKFFKGPYHNSYIRIAVLYRLSFFLLQTMMPIMIIVWYKERKLINLLLVILPIVLLTLTLARGAAFNGILLGLAIICAYRSRLLIFIYTLFLIFVYVIGSMSFYLVGIIFGIDTLINILPDGSVWQLIASGSPDVNDQLTFLTSFNAHSVYTSGRTIFGGLVPGSYAWNPSIYTLSVINPGADVTTIASGGLRLPVPVWGYVSFGWIGVVVFSILSGIITAYCIKYVKAWIQGADLTKVTIILLLLGSLGVTLTNFYLISMYSFPVIFAMFLYCYKFKFK
jgi:hypothetical protein